MSHVFFFKSAGRQLNYIVFASLVIGRETRENSGVAKPEY